MTYADCLQYLERLGNEVVTMKFGLETIRKLLSSLGDPQDRTPGILIAGTNGKGSVARFLASILARSGYRTGLYTSPHLITLRERIRIDGEKISESAFAGHFTTVVDAVQGLQSRYHPTYFETLTATAFKAFETAGTEVNVLEIGMGGRLDSTNIITPAVSVLTPISLDHRDWLGSTIEEIASEKAGIIHRGSPVVTAPQVDEAEQVIARVCRDLGAELHRIACPSNISSSNGRYSFDYGDVQVRLSQPGQHQIENAAVAIEAARVLSEQGFRFSKDAIEVGLGAVQPEASLRWLEENPRILLDGAHNPASAMALANFLRDQTSPPRTLVFGMMGDKDVEEVAASLSPLFDQVYLTAVASPRACPTNELKKILPEGIPVEDPIEALLQATRHRGIIVVAGSLYLVGKILENRDQLQST